MGPRGTRSRECPLPPPPFRVHSPRGPRWQARGRSAESGRGWVHRRPAVLEGEATARAIRLAKFVNAPLYVVHVMSIDAMEEVAKARKEGQRVIGEPVASGLSVDERKMWDPDFKIAAQYVMSPPIRELPKP